MKNVLFLCFSLCFIQVFSAQNLTYGAEESLIVKSVNKTSIGSKFEELRLMHRPIENYKKRSPIYDFYEKGLNNIDTITNFNQKPNPLKITGTIYEKDGKTPAENVLLFIHQANEKGNFKRKRFYGKRHVNHRAWIKTDADGKYTFYTFIPGKFYFSNGLPQILPVIKEPNKPEYKIDPFVFDFEGTLSKSYRAKINKAKNSNLVLKLTKVKKADSTYIYTAQKDITLGSGIESYH